MEFPGTYYLAYRDLPEIILQTVTGRRALDFGCGAGRSTRFLRKLGFETTGIDISEEMIRQAKGLDPAGDYRLIQPGDFSAFEPDSFDLILCAFPFDNISGWNEKIYLFSKLGSLLKPEGKLVNLVSSPEIYTHEWNSFSTKDFPENRIAKSGDKVRIVITAIDDARPVEDTFCTDEDYLNIYRASGMKVVYTHRPLARVDEPYTWVHETTISPWVIYVLQRA
jgi:SAM-dependent methyltransferase